MYYFKYSAGESKNLFSNGIKRTGASLSYPQDYFTYPAICFITVYNILVSLTFYIATYWIFKLITFQVILVKTICCYLDVC